MSYLNNCRICNSRDIEPVIDLGNQPWANNFLKKEFVGTEKYYPLCVAFCHNCSCAQLNYTVKKEIMFSDHTYLSGMTTTLSNYFKDLAAYVDKSFSNDFEKKNILDIGSNDGTQLKHYQDLGWQVLGVEPSKTIANIASSNGINTINEFFNEDCINLINEKFSIINASGVFFHLEELHSVTSAIKKGLVQEGIFIVQFLYINNIFENIAFDQIYHEHLLYYSLKSLSNLINQYELEIFDAKLADVHGGQMIAFICHKGYREKTKRFFEYINAENINNCNSFAKHKVFSEKINNLKEINLNYLYDKKRKGNKIFGLGAPVKGNTLLNYFDIGIETIDYLVEKNPLREGLYSPGKHIPIVLEEKIIKQPDLYYVLAWNFKNEILQKYSTQIEEGIKFYFPIKVVK